MKMSHRGTAERLRSCVAGIASGAAPSASGDVTLVNFEGDTQDGRGRLIRQAPSTAIGLKDSAFPNVLNGSKADIAETLPTLIRTD